jgi:cell division protein FtsB
MTGEGQARASGRRWLFRLALAVGLAVCLGYLPYQAYGPQGMGRISHLKRQWAEIQQKNRRLVGENERLRHQIIRLRDDRHALEKVARDELGLVRPSDIVFQFE